MSHLPVADTFTAATEQPATAAGRSDGRTGGSPVAGRPLVRPGATEPQRQACRPGSGCSQRDGRPVERDAAPGMVARQGVRLRRRRGAGVGPERRGLVLHRTDHPLTWRITKVIPTAHDDIHVYVVDAEMGGNPPRSSPYGPNDSLYRATLNAERRKAISGQVAQSAHRSRVPGRHRLPHPARSYPCCQCRRRRRLHRQPDRRSARYTERNVGRFPASRGSTLQQAAILEMQACPRQVPRLVRVAGEGTRVEGSTPNTRLGNGRWPDWLRCRPTPFTQHELGEQGSGRTT